jgi:hypothetical protein
LFLKPFGAFSFFSSLHVALLHHSNRNQLWLWLQPSCVLWDVCGHYKIEELCIIVVGTSSFCELGSFGDQAWRFEFLMRGEYWGMMLLISCSSLGINLLLLFCRLPSSLIWIFQITRIWARSAAVQGLGGMLF